MRGSSGSVGGDPEGFAPELREEHGGDQHAPGPLPRRALARSIRRASSWPGRRARVGPPALPLATYHSPCTVIREEPNTSSKPARSVGSGSCTPDAARRNHAPEVAAGTVDPQAGSQPRRGRAGGVAEHPTTGRPPSMPRHTLTRSCPSTKVSPTGWRRARPSTAATRELAHPASSPTAEVGGLLPYADSAAKLVVQQFARYHAWLAVLDRAGWTHTLLRDGRRAARSDLLEPRS